MKLKFKVTGMTCAACSARVEKVTKAVPGVEGAEVNLLAGTMAVEAENDQVTECIIRAVENAGYQASVPGSEAKEAPQEKDPLKEMKTRIWGSALCLVVLMYFTMGHMVGLPVPGWYHSPLVAALLQFFLTLPVVYLNRVYYGRGLTALWHRGPNMDSLIAVGSLAALVYGVAALFRMAYALDQGDMATVKLYSENLYFESAAMILTLITLGKFLEARAKGKTGDAIRALMDLSPKVARVRREDQVIEVPVDQVNVGDTVIVRSGDQIPVDGTVLSGRASIDQSALTGESVPVEKLPGDTVAAATISTEGYLEFRADKVGADTTLSQVIRMVEEAGGSKAPIARLADKIAGIFVPTVMVIAAVTFAAWMLAGYGLEFALRCGISVLVISCPCALGLATPVAIMVGTGRGAQMGVLFKNAEALEKLRGIADGFLLHDREIQTRCDDSLCWVLEGKEYPARRSRGYVPFPLRMEGTLQSVLACGAEQKASFCLSKGSYVFPSQHIGDLKNMETLENYTQQIAHFKHLFDIEPTLVTCDLHPDYMSTEYAQSLGLPLVQVQHHHAHLAACMADNGLAGEVIGLVWDGTGYGTDGTAWGGECLVGGYETFRRFGHILPMALPGGDRATKEIDRLAFSLLYAADCDTSFVPAAETYRAMLAAGLNCPLSSGMGRLFDGVAAILGIRTRCSYEGQGAILLEAAAKDDGGTYPVLLSGRPLVFDWREMIRAIVQDRQRGVDTGVIAARFMNTLVEMAVKMAVAAREETGLNRVCLSGGSFQNMYIMHRLPERLRAVGFEVYHHSRVSANDEGIALGQLMIANAKWKGKENVSCRTPEID